MWKMPDWRETSAAEAERTKSVRGFVVYASGNLGGEITEEEREFLRQLIDKVFKAARGHKYGSIRLKSINLDID